MDLEAFIPIFILSGVAALGLLYANWNQYRHMLVFRSYAKDYSAAIITKENFQSNDFNRFTLFRLGRNAKLLNGFTFKENSITYTIIQTRWYTKESNDDSPGGWPSPV
jgi:hypothetical protein